MLIKLSNKSLVQGTNKKELKTTLIRDVTRYNKSSCWIVEERGEICTLLNDSNFVLDIFTLITVEATGSYFSFKKAPNLKLPPQTYSFRIKTVTVINR